MSSDTVIDTLTNDPSGVDGTEFVSSCSERSSGAVLSQEAPRMLTFTAATRALSMCAAPMLLALSCICTCSSCQSPQSRQLGVENSQFHVSLSAARHEKPIRAIFDGLMKFPLTRFTPDLSSIAWM